jgi:peptidyl-prolyl cis-trans isomerase D
MLSFFRGENGSKIVAVVLGLGLLAIVATGTGTGSGGFSSISSLLRGSSDAIATVGGATLTPAEVTQRATAIVEQQRQQQPDFTLQSLAASGALDQVIDAMLGERALEYYGNAHGMTVSKRAIDAELAQIPSLQGIDGKFDRAHFLQVLGQRHLTEEQARGDIGRDLIKQQLLVPIAGAAAMPKSLVNAYAALLLEVRDGKIAAIPSIAMTKVPKPSEAVVLKYYATHPAQYSLPERRVIEYIVYDKAKFADAAKPSEAEIAAAYAKDKDKYTAKDLRSFEQVIVPDEAKAKALAEKVRGGASMKDAAKAIGFESITLANQDKAAFAGLSSPEVANAAFNAARGQVAPVAKSGLGWHVVKIVSVTHDPGKTLDEARPEIVKALSAVKIEEVFANFQNKIQDKASAGATLVDIAKINGATVQTTPAIIYNGSSADQPDYHPAPEMVPLLKDAFKADAKVSSEPAIVGYGKTRDQAAIYHIKQILPSGPVAFDKVREKATADAYLDAQSKAARVVAQGVVDKLNHGTSFADALKATGLQLPPLQPVKLSKVQLAQIAQRSQQPVPPALIQLFSVPLHRAKLAEAPGGQGWSVVWLDATTPVDPATQPAVVQQVQQQLGASYGQEISSEFAVAAQQSLGAKKYPANIKATTSAMQGNNGQ